MALADVELETLISDTDALTTRSRDVFKISPEVYAS